MKRTFKRVGMVVIILLIAIGVMFYALIKKTDENFADLIAMPVQAIDLSKLSDGSYSGAYSVFPVDVEVTVEVSANKIVNITIDKHVNGKGMPAEEIVNTVVKQQSLDVDMISGATYSSKVILKAIEHALLK